MTRWLLIVAAGLGLTVAPAAQDVTVTVRGTVADWTGAVVPGAEVQVLGDDDTVVQRTTTDAMGQFTLRDLPVGTYTVRVSAPGLVPRSKSITVGPSNALTLDFTLPRPTGPKARPPAPAPPPPPPPAMPAPGPTAPHTAPKVPAPADADTHALVPVYYATDRNRVAYTPLSYGGEREPTAGLHLGRIDVSIPRDHQPGQVERPSIWTLWREDPARHFVIVRASEEGYDEFYRDLGATIARSSRKEAFVFVHGFNVTFESAVYRTAQLAYDIGFDGAPILYSWPSVGKPAAYPTDANNSGWTSEHLRWFLEDVAARSGAEYIHVIAHSRGNGPVLDALKAIATSAPGGRRPHFRQILLTAPDVDAGTFRQIAPHLRSIGDRTTLYASANDEALKLSKAFQGYQRAGDVSPSIVVVNGVDSIDVSAVDTSFLGHSYYGDNTSVISDIARLLSTGLEPDRRCGLQSIADVFLRHWAFMAHAICPIGSGP